MRIPKEVKIKSVNFKVSLEDLGDDLFGNYGENPPIIRINNKAPEDYKEMTLIHEILHILRGGMKENEVRELAWDLWAVLFKENKLI